MQILFEIKTHNAFSGEQVLHVVIRVLLKPRTSCSSHFLDSAHKQIEPHITKHDHHDTP